MSLCKAPRIVPVGWDILKAQNFEAIRRTNDKGMTVVYSEEYFDGTEVDCPPMGAGDYKHISLSRQDHYPSWDEMRDYIYSSNWFDKERDVVMFLPPKKFYVNVHNNCFHFYQKVNP